MAVLVAQLVAQSREIWGPNEGATSQPGHLSVTTSSFASHDLRIEPTSYDDVQLTAAHFLSFLVRS